MISLFDTEINQAIRQFLSLDQDHSASTSEVSNYMSHTLNMHGLLILLPHACSALKKNLQFSIAVAFRTHLALVLI